MLHYMHLHHMSYQQIYLIFGTRVKGDILYFEELKELAGQMPKVHYIPTLSREKWDGATGYVHAVYEDLVQKQMQEATDGTRQPKPAYFFLCGWKNMIDEAKQRILALGYDKKSIHQELYG
jgi:CDP-4-dehydro-6-deoxyglucose reductase